ncbi:bifunctional metallophosphatase/5'-nucleotidase [Rossellomorea aquimaris]|uniref:bifunctional metallophosphatase/5'-nucleotidase n=1 Tax=Rossellomorea aquimaris TaxID=189382 RepID=UPI001CFEC4E4|nr:5'-nucleotidase C-terminal domain-containing protein [Rossellomorea aquimaris]
MKRSGILVVLVIIMVTATSFIPKKNALAIEKDGFLHLSILHTNDVHAHLENIPYLHTAIKEIREKDGELLLLDAGDVFSGTLYFNQYLGQADAEFMNKIGYNAMTLGNHEFDKGSKVLAAFIEALSFPVVSSNVEAWDDRYLAPLMRKGIPDRAEGGSIYPAIMQSVKGVKVGIIGLTTEDTAFLSKPGDTIVFRNAEEKAMEEVAHLKGKGVNHIIVLSHLGLSRDKRLAQKVKGIDIIIGGHSHSKLTTPLVYNLQTEPTLIVQANEYGMSLGEVQAVFSDAGVLTSWNGRLIDVLAKDEEGKGVYRPDPWALKRLSQLKKPIEDLKGTVIGFTNVPLNGDRHAVRTTETNLGNLITDAMLEEANQFAPTQVAFQNGGGIRRSIDAGEITLDEILEVLPFGNSLVTLNLSGEEILQALEHSVAKVDEESGQFLQVSGLSFHFDPTRAVGERVSNVKVQGERLDRAKSYRVAVNAFLADGGDGFNVFRDAKENGRITELYLNLYEVISGYLTKHSPVSLKVEGRISEESS